MPHFLVHLTACSMLALGACTEAPSEPVPRADAAPQAPAQSPLTEARPSAGPVEVADGRSFDTPPQGSLSASDRDLLLNVSQQAHDHWERVEPQADHAPTEIMGVASGSFTGTGEAQFAVLYSVAWAMPSRQLGGLAIVEPGRGVVSNVAAEGYTSLHALSDLDGNGHDELVLEGGETNMGETVSSVLVAEVSDLGVRVWGRAFVYRDDCGGALTGAEATRLTATSGETPTFEAERFESPGTCEGDSTWNAVGAPSPVRLEPADDTFADLRAR